MSFPLPNIEHVQLDAVLPRVKIRNRSDLMNFIARAIAPSIFHTPEELNIELTKAIKDAGIGGGLAMPYITLPRLTQPFSALITLDKPLDFGASDARPVSMIFVLILPEKDGALNRVQLARLSRLFRNPSLCAQIIEAKNENEIFAAFLTSEDWKIAA